MLARLYSSQYFFIAMVVSSFFTCTAEASVRAIIIPGKAAILVMEAISGTGIDPDPRRLYDAIAIPPVSQAGGDGKIVKTADKTFSLICGTKNTTRDSVLCNINIKPSPQSKFAMGTAEYHLTGGEAAPIFEMLAGHNGADFHYTTSDGALKIDASPEQFDFVYGH